MKFQEKAIATISNEVREALSDEDTVNRSQSIVLKSPTGSGKTLMISQIISRSLKGALTLVLSPGKGDLHTQTFRSLSRYLGNDENVKVKEFSLETFEENPDGGTVVVGNWEKLTTRDKKTGEYSVHLTRNGDRQNIFDYLAKCGEEVPVAIIIDEAHYGASNDAKRIRSFLEDINNAVIAAGGLSTIVVEASATPLVSVNGNRKTHIVSEREVIDAGLMRKSGVLNADLPDHTVKEKDKNSTESGDYETIEHYLLAAADDKRKELNELYRKTDSEYNALLAVQIPNSVLGKDAQERTLAFFAGRDMTVENGRVVIFTSAVKEGDIENISSPKSNADVLIYKQSISTGWDCPRAQVLVGFRHIKSQVFTIQNIGRFRRATEATHYEGADLDALNKFYVYSNIETGFGLHAYDQGKGVDGEVGPRMERTLEADASKLEKINGYGLPITSYSRINQDPVSRSVVYAATAKVVFGDDSPYKELPYSSSANVSLFQGEYAAEILGDIEKMQKADNNGKSVQTASKRSDFEQSQNFSNIINDVVGRAGNFGNNARLVDSIIGAVTPLFASTVWAKGKKRLTKAQVIDSFLDSADNQKALIGLVEDILSDDAIQNHLVVEQGGDDTSVPVTQYNFNPARAHKFPESILIVEDSDRSVRAAFHGKTLFYKQSKESEDKISWWQEHSSVPERLFQDQLEKFIASNQDYELVVIHKNAPWLDGKNLSLGLAIRVEGSEDKGKRIANFFPDFIIVLRHKVTGAEFPVIIEVKDGNAQKDNGLDKHLQHKVRASHDYYKNTGIPFFTVESKESASSIIGTDDRPREEQHRGVDLFTVISGMLDSGIVIKEAKKQDGKWMEGLGL